MGILSKENYCSREWRFQGRSGYARRLRSHYTAMLSFQIPVLLIYQNPATAIFGRYRTVTCEVESEQNSALFINSGKSQYSIASRYCISGFVLAAGSKSRKGRREELLYSYKLTAARDSAVLFPLGKCGHGNLLVVIQNTRCVQKV